MSASERAPFFERLEEYFRSFRRKWRQIGMLWICVAIAVCLLAKGRGGSARWVVQDVGIFVVCVGTSVIVLGGRGRQK